MILTPCLIDIIAVLSHSIVLVYLHLCWIQLLFTLFASYSKAKYSMLQMMIASMIQTGQLPSIHVS
jgi:hypothetical protein